MNQLKTIFKVVDKKILEPLRKEILHFASPKAYKFLIDAKDTRRTFQTLLCYYMEPAQSSAKSILSYAEIMKRFQRQNDS